MKSAPLHDQEEQRIAALQRYEILDTEAEIAFDELTELASTICGTPISLVSLVDVDRQWFKSKVGLDAEETEREIAFCSHAILQDKVFEIPDALDDERFFDNPLVTGAPDIRFYAGAPLVTDSGEALGTLCVIDTVPKHLTEQQRSALKTLSHQVVGQLELRLRNRKLQRSAKMRELIYATVAHDLRSPFNGILSLSKMLNSKANSSSPEKIAQISHMVLQSSTIAFQVLDELLQWSHHQLSSRAVELESRNVRSELEDVITFLQPLIDGKNLVLNVSVGDDLHIQVDTTLAKTVFRNLIANAIKFTPTGGVISVSARKNGAQVEVAIVDSGSGVPASSIASLFSEVSESIEGTQGEKGSGLGLNLCREFVELQQGNIWLDEEYNRCEDTPGARFVVSYDAT